MATTIMLDAGHGGYDNGATYMGRREKDDTLALTLALGDILKRAGYNVIFTRESDIYQSPVKKAQIANESGADYFISLHRNAASYPNQYEGVQTLIFSPGGVKQEMAENINKNLEELGFKNIDVSIRPDLAVLRRTRMPAVLVEAGFIDSDKDNAIFDQQLNQVAQAIATGIEETIGAAQTVATRNEVTAGNSQFMSDAYLKGAVPSVRSNNVGNPIPSKNSLYEEKGENYGILILGFSSMEEALKTLQDIELNGHTAMIVQ